MKTKEEVRKDITRKLLTQTEAERKKKSLAIKMKLFNLPEFKNAKVVMLYVSTEFEVGTDEMIDDALLMGKKVAVPYVIENERRMKPSFIKDRKKDLAPGPYGIYQPGADSPAPISDSEIDLVVVPGVAFTGCGKRLGRGGGYYDRFLKGLPKKTHTVGIAFGVQVLGDLPQGEQDIPVDRVITELS